MNPEHWIEVIGRAISMNFECQVEDEGSGLTFDYDLEALYSIQTALESGATSEEIETQYDEFVQGDFERFVSVLEQALDEDNEEAYEEPGETAPEPPVIQEVGASEDAAPSIHGNPEVSGGGDISEDQSQPSPSPRTNKKKGLFITAGFSALVLIILAGGFVGYKLFKPNSAPSYQANTVTPIERSSPKSEQKLAEKPDTETVVPTPKTAPSQATANNYSVEQMDSDDVRSFSGNEQMSAKQQMSTAVATESGTQKGTAGLVSSAPVSSSPANSGLDEEDLKERFGDFENTIESQVDKRFSELKQYLETIEKRVSTLNDLEAKLSAKQEASEAKSELVKQKTQGLTRLGEFSILKTSGLNNRVVALSPTNRVITLEEGERNVLAAGSNLTVQEIVGDGEAVIFTDGWYIDEVRAPESLRERRLTAEAQSNSSTSDSSGPDPQVTGTAKVADSPSPAKVAANARTEKAYRTTSTSNSERFPTIKRAPSGWEATALIPPRRAVIVNPDGDSFTINSGSEIAGLGKVHSVTQDRVLAGQFYIPLSNM